MLTHTLIVVDCQNDFSRPGAPLRVAGADKAITAIAAYIGSSHIQHVIFTVDWHPTTHCSFQANGGPWPTHCVQHTEGAAIRNELLEACTQHNVPYSVYVKGTDPTYEEYGAFAGVWSETSEHYSVCHPTRGHFLIPKPTGQLIVCGIAGDYCVKETLKHLAPLRPKVFLAGVAHIGSEQTLLDTMQALSITSV